MAKKQTDKKIAEIKPFVQNTEGFKFHWAVALAIAVITLFVYQPALENGWTNWDDPVYVLENDLIIMQPADQFLNKDHIKKIFSEKNPVSLNYHPLTILTLAYDYKKTNDEKDFPSRAKQFHQTNLMIHILNGMLVFYFVFLLTGRKIIHASIVSFVFALHPMHVESVAWIAERKDVLYTFFFLSSLICYLMFAKKKHYLWLVLSFILFYASVLSKAMAVVLPLVLIAMDYYQSINWRKTLTDPKFQLLKLPFFALSVYYGLLAYRIQATDAIAKDDTFNFIQKLCFASYGFFIYIAKFIFPFQLSAFYPYPVIDGDHGLPVYFYLFPFLLSAFVLMMIWFFRKNQKAIVFSAAFFFFTVVLVLQYISVGSAIMAERYSYIPYIGVAFVLGYFIQLVIYQKEKFSSSLRMLVISVLCIWFIGIIVVTAQRIKVWKNNETLWTDVIEKFPGKVEVAYKNRGNYYGKELGKFDLALNDYNELIKMKTKDPEVFSNLGNIYGMMGKEYSESGDMKNANNYYAKSLEAYSQSISFDSTFEQAYFNRSVTNQMLGNHSAAIDDLNRAIQYSPKSVSQLVQRYFNRGFSYSQIGQYQNAINDYNEVLKMQPNNGEAFLQRGLVYYNLNDFNQSLSDFQQSIKFNPNSPQAYMNAAASLYRMSRWQDALNYAQQAKAKGQDVSPDFLNELQNNINAQ